MRITRQALLRRFHHALLSLDFEKVTKALASPGRPLSEII